MRKDIKIIKENEDGTKVYEAKNYNDINEVSSIYDFKNGDVICLSVNFDEIDDTLV